MASDKAAMVSCATSIVEQLSVEQKVAQMIQGEIRGLSADDVKKYGLGSVLNGGGCLLYTSPSPRDSIRSRMPSSA